MRFENVHVMIYAVWIVPALLIFYIWASGKRKAAMEKFANPELLEKIAASYSKRAIILRALFDAAAVFFIILSLAGPQWGFYWKENKGMGVDIIFAVDTSRSMLADDMRPDRLTLSKRAIKNFVNRLKGDRIGLLAFAGRAFLQCPLTVDYSGFNLVLNSIEADIIPRGGTSISLAVEEAIKSYKDVDADNKILIFVTDGESTEGDIEKALAKARKEKIMISCVGVGTPKGSTVSVRDESGRKILLKDKNDNSVISRLEEKILKKIADTTGGMYVRANEDDFGLDKIYDEKLSILEKKEAEGKKVKVYKERFQIPLLVALLALMTILIFGEKKENV
ncbi:MAG: VWA domain-containing protein [Candidatus Omnitrophica bacterium]|nr:VWA domain-containing protein [Candidatus Omnitrophota bacterium]